MTPESTAQKLVQTRPLACVTLDITALVELQLLDLQINLLKAERFAQLVVTVSQAHPRPSTARAAITIQRRVKRPSLTVFCAYQANTVLVRRLLQLADPASMDITVLLAHQSMISGLPHLVPSLTQSLNGRVLKIVGRELITTCGIRVCALTAQKASIAELWESLTISSIAQSATTVKLDRKILRSAQLAPTTQHQML